MSNCTNPSLIPYRVMLHQEPGDTFQLAFDCMADDDDHAVEQCENAYPGCEIVSYLPFDGSPLDYVIYSPNESALGNGFWSNKDGWVELAQATRFTKHESETMHLPVATGGDSKWVLFEEANRSYGGEMPQAGDWLQTLAPGDQVWWNDPDNGISSGYYTITEIQAEGKVLDGTVLCLKNEAGSSAEVFAREIASVQPEDLFPVVDGETGVIDRYGYARSKEEALDVGNATFTDEVVDAYLAENVVLRDGTTVPKAWVAVASLPAATATVRLTLDVTYALNGVDAAEMIGRLERMCENAIGNGMLTGETPAEVEEHSMHALMQPEPLSEEELAGFMLQRIENGELAAEDMPVRLARYGLMEPSAFVEEMRERMELAKDDE